MWQSYTIVVQTAVLPVGAQSVINLLASLKFDRQMGHTTPDYRHSGSQVDYI